MKFFSYIFSFFYLTGFSQSASESLIVIHYDASKKAELGQFIYKYNYVNNVYAGREKIMTVTGRKNEKDYVRCDKGDNVLYKDRYLISGIGNIIDLKEKKVLYDGSAKLVRCSNDSIIFFTNDIFKGKYYSYYDLKTNVYSEIKSLTFKPIAGQDVEFDRAKSPYKLYYYPQSKAKVLLMDDAGHGGVSATSNKVYDIPIYWIDNDNFLFPNIKITDLEGSIVKYTISTKTIKSIGTFNSTAKVLPTYKIVKGANTIVEFYFKDKLFLINPAKETMLQSFYKEYDVNFSVEMEEKPTGRGIWYKGKEIGKDHFDMKNFKSSANYAAIVKEIVMGDESYQQGMSVYNIYKAKWEPIDGEEVACLIGWIKQ
ncbi:MAG: hypothetical protein V4506_06725 [Bacteroidota bacterium]